MANLTELLQGRRPGRFEPRAQYVADGDALIFYFKDDESYAKRVDELLTLFLSIKTKHLVGCQIKGVRRILEKLGSFGVQIQDGDVDLRVIFMAYAFTSKRIPPSETLEELRSAAERSQVRVALKELAAV